ncbi:protein-disulfide reductase DsbD [Campylobacter sp. CCS1377]|uniref:Protein-disulfide reductase DsbD n=1 Tax=Campylobacter sp. CCS1377 TaxID=3158229 RepID=A0AAU7E3W9_9BACT
MRICLFLFIFINFLFANPLSLEQAFKHTYNFNSQGVSVKITLGKDIYLYQKELKILLANQDITDLISLPKAINKNGEKVFYHQLNLSLPKILLEHEMQDKALLDIYFQGCSEQGLCYKPQILHFEIQKNQQNYEIKPATQNIQTNVSEEQNIANNMEKKSFILVLLSFFGYGLLLSLTPCTLPMIPILSSLILSKSTYKPSKKYALWLCFIYVFFMSLAYGVAGVIASFLGASLQGLLQKPLVLIIFALIFVLLSLSLFGLFRLELPLKFQNFIQKKSNKGKGVLGVASMGFLSALIVGPCVAAPLAGALIYIANSKDALLGGLALFTMSFGMGLPLFLVGFGVSFLKAGIWMQKIQFFFAFLMLAMALWILSRILDASLILIGFGILGVFFSVFMGLFDNDLGVLNKIKKACLILILSYSLALFLGGLFGGKYFLKPFNITSTIENKNLNFNHITKLSDLKNIINDNEKVLVYFTASWCENCKLLDEYAFSNEKVQEKLKNYTLIKVDVSQNNEEQIKIMKEFSVFGPPVLIFLDNQKENLKITGYINTNDLLQRLDQ